MAEVTNVLHLSLYIMDTRISVTEWLQAFSPALNL